MPRKPKSKVETSEEEEEEVSMKGGSDDDDRKPAAREDDESGDELMQGNTDEEVAEGDDPQDEEAVDDEEVVEDEQPEEIVIGSTPGNQFKGYLNYSIKAHSEIYKLAIQPLTSTKYDLSPSGLLNFVENMKDRAYINGWSGYAGIFTIVIMDEKGKDVELSVLDSYSSITLEQIQENELLALSQPKSRAGQDTGMVFQCLMASITEGAQARVRMHVSEYTLQGKRSGVCVFKVITRLSSANYYGTVTALRTKLQKLDEWVTKNGDNVIDLNQYVRETLARLATYGQMTLDMVPNLFRGYEEIKNSEFKQYIALKKQVYEEGTTTLTHDALMNAAEIKYTGLVEKGQWVQSDDNKQIVALSAQVKKLSQQLRGNKKSKGKNAKAKTDRKRESKHSARKKDPEWIRNHVAPARDRLNKPRPHNSKIWWWCSKDTGGQCDGKWRLHQPTECKGLAKRTEDSASDAKKSSKTATEGKNEPKKSTASPAVASMQLESDSE